MTQRAVASRYAEGLFRAAEAGELEPLRRELDELVDLVEAVPDLRALLERPDLEAEQKMAALEAVFGGEVARPILGLLNTLVRHHRGSHLSAVAEAFDELADEAEGVARAVVRTAAPLTREQEERLHAALTRLAGREVVLEVEVAPEVLAGVSVQIGDRLIDGTAEGRLAELRQMLMRTEGWVR